MDVVPAADVLQGHIAADNEVIAHGWIHIYRDSKVGISLFTVYDGSCFDPVQTVTNDSLPNYNEGVLRLITGCSVIVTDKAVVLPGQGQQFGIQVSKVKVTDWVEDPDTYPTTTERHSIEYLREVIHLCPRTNLTGATTHVRHTLAQTLHHFFNEQGSLWVPTPLITTLDTEGVGEIFRVSTLDLENLSRNDQSKVGFNKDFFGKGSFLTVSGQLNGETYACILSKIHTFGPTFHAENSNISRHLAEFRMPEPEVVFIDLNDIAGPAEAMLKCVLKMVLEERANDMKFFAERVDKDAVSRLERFIEADSAQADYADAVTILENCGRELENPVYWGVDLSSEHERYLAEEHFKTPVVVKNYPKDIKASYMRPNEDGEIAVVTGVLASSVGEITGGSQREERLDVLDERMLEIGLNKEDYWRYHDLHRYGTVSHSGLGLGFERLIAYITGAQSVCDVIPFSRTPRNASL